MKNLSKLGVTELDKKEIRLTSGGACSGGMGSCCGDCCGKGFPDVDCCHQCCMDGGGKHARLYQ